ncbi:MAG: methane monooxygenase/ammonia monooxygenase subunit C [bacterium]
MSESSSVGNRMYSTGEITLSMLIVTNVLLVPVVAGFIFWYGWAGGMDAVNSTFGKQWGYITLVTTVLLPILTGILTGWIWATIPTQSDEV